jgi:hypothetical protein
MELVGTLAKYTKYYDKTNGPHVEQQQIGRMTGQRQSIGR